jgi:virulence-associated protein VapD
MTQHKTRRNNKMNSTQIKRYEKAGEIKQALLTLGFKNIQGHYFSNNPGENRFCTGEYSQKEIDTFLKILSRAGEFEDGVKVIQKDINSDGEEPMLEWFISSPDYDGDHWLYDIRFVNIEFDGDKLSSININYSTIENGVEYGQLDWELYSR